ncbi:MAG: serine hydrolase [Gemmatimonadales bacterium]
MRIGTCTLIALLGLAPPVCAQQGTANADFLGYWGAERFAGPLVRGELLLTRSTTGWTLGAGGMEARGPANGDSLVITLPGEQGTLRAWNLGGPAPEAFWIQPPGNIGAYATPLTLARISPSAWRATITPFDDRMSLYLHITPDTAGTMRAVIRNPDFNFGARWPWFRLTRGDGTVTFVDPVTGRGRFTQPYDSADGSITFFFSDPIVLRKRSAEQVPGLMPRIGATTYSYRTPMLLGDGWPTRSASAVGMNDSLLTALVQRIIATDPDKNDFPAIHSVVVLHRGVLVLDEYFRGYAADQVHDLRSASKTFTGVMAGIAMARTHAFTMESSIATLLDAKEMNPDITLAHLLTHRSGLACDDDDEMSPGNEDIMQEKSKDWYGHAIALPQLHPAGAHYAYCSAGINLAGAAIGRATHRWLPRFFAARIAKPMQIDRWAMNLMPDGEGYSGGGMQLRPRDFLKFGEVFLRGGKWHGRQVVSAEWVDVSTSKHSDVPDGSTDGYAWHRHTLTAGGRAYETFEAGGNGGQFMIVIPALDLAVAVTAGNYGQYQVWRRIREEIVPQYVMAAVGHRG